MRETVKVRMVAGSLVISLPQSVLEPVGLKEGDRVIVEAAPPRRLLITKEGKIMNSSQHLEMEIDLLEKRKAAMESDLTFKHQQYKLNMPVEEGMSENDVAGLMMMQIVRDRDRLNVDIADKRIQLYEVQGADIPAATEPSPSEEEVAAPSKKTERGWYHSVDRDGREYFLALVSAKGRSSLRRFAADTGKAFKKDENRKGDYRLSFAKELENATPLHVSKQPNLQVECKDRLPGTVLADLQRQAPRKQ